MSSSDKPGFFGRLKQVISSNVNDAVDSMSDPGQELALMLDQLEEQIKSSEKDLRQAVVSRKMSEKKIVELTAKEQDWEKRAEQALGISDESLARAALEKKRSYGDERAAAQLDRQEQQGVIESMQEGINTSKTKLKSLNLRRGTLMAQARANKQNEAAGTGYATGAESKIDAIEDKISQIEAYNEVMSETNQDQVETLEVQRKFRELDQATEMDDELAALKAKIKDKKALTDGSES